MIEYYYIQEAWKLSNCGKAFHKRVNPISKEEVYGMDLTTLFAKEWRPVIQVEYCDFIAAFNKMQAEEVAMKCEDDEYSEIYVVRGDILYKLVDEIYFKLVGVNTIIINSKRWYVLSHKEVE